MKYREIIVRYDITNDKITLEPYESIGVYARDLRTFREKKIISFKYDYNIFNILCERAKQINIKNGLYNASSGILKRK